MDTQPIVRERMTTVFSRLASDLNLGEALASLQSTANPYGVIMDQVNAPLGLVTVDDLRRVLRQTGEEAVKLPLVDARRWLPPLVVIAADNHLVDVVESTQITLITYGARGMVVTEKGKVVGVLPRETIASYLATEYRPPDTTAGYGLPGVEVTEAGVVVCDACNTPNTIDFLDPGHLPLCVNQQEPIPGRHRLKLGWL